ncbi:MAG: hypothetical protein MI747_05960 [Desulfobacterales bacterium]|nr:hypothetical protein [Desulfobacterales bacterium]
MAKSITIQELKNMMKHKRKLKLLDVRRKGDFSAAPQRIPSAKWVDPEEVESWIYTLPMGDFTVAYCKKGGPVSQSVVNRLAREGLDAVFLEGGIKAWKDQHGPVDSSEE